MGLIRTIAILVVALSLIVFVALFGRLPAFRRTPVGFLHRVVWIYLPRVCGGLDQHVTGGRVSQSLQQSSHYLMNEPHPLVMFFFIALQLGSEVLFVPAAWSQVSTLHRVLMGLLVSLPYFTLYLSYATTNNITPLTHSSNMTAYPYDHTLFYPGHICHTCKLAKPARSKHCPICKACIQKQDHHCIWINNCVGRNNYIWFMSLLLATSLLLLYGACLGYSILDESLQNRFVPPDLVRGSLTAKRWSTRFTWGQYLDCWAWAIAMQARIGAVTLLAGMSFPLSTGFLVYHSYLIWAGMTTNESSKWADLREDIEDELAFKSLVEDLKGDYPALGDNLEPKVVRWPQRGKWWVIRTQNGTQPKRIVNRQEAGSAQEEDDPRWRRIKSLVEVENVYDLGLGGNLWDALFNRG